MARLWLTASVHWNFNRHAGRTGKGASSWARIGLVLMLSAASQLKAELKPEQIYRRILPSVMTLEVENHQGERFVGSAVLALADDVAITCWHVIQDAKLVSAVFADGQRVKGVGCVDFDKGRDIALIRLEKKLPHRQAMVSAVAPSIATKAYAIGTPKGSPFTFTDGLISQIRNTDGIIQYQVSCPISPGNSGGPILNSKAQVIGIASWTKTDAQNMSFAIPISEATHLNTERPVTQWVSFQPTNSISVVTSVHPKNQQEARSIEPLNSSEDAFLKELKNQFKEFPRKNLTVTIQDEKRLKKFTVSVPE